MGLHMRVDLGKGTCHIVHLNDLDLRDLSPQAGALELANYSFLCHPDCTPVAHAACVLPVL